MKVKVFKNGPSKICERQSLKKLTDHGRPYHFKFFKRCLAQILLGPFWNTLPHIKGHVKTNQTFIAGKLYLKLFHI